MYIIKYTKLPTGQVAGENFWGLGIFDQIWSTFYQCCKFFWVQIVMQRQGMICSAALLIWIGVCDTAQYTVALPVFFIKQFCKYYRLILHADCCNCLCMITVFGFVIKSVIIDIQFSAVIDTKNLYECTMYS